jgi:hypothetical protein
VLVACPFCRELFDERERKSCSVCGVALMPIERLPPSLDVQSENGLPHDPSDDPLPLAYLGRGRGALAAAALCGLAAFLSPWVHVTLPDVVTLSGFALARRLGWAWGAWAAWFVLLPTVLSRRTVAKMRGARVAAAFLAAVPGVTCAVLLARPPHGSHLVPLRFSWGAGLYATVGLSAFALGVAMAFGGRKDDLRVRPASSQGELLH